MTAAANTPRAWESKASRAISGGDNLQRVDIWEIRHLKDQNAAALLGLSLVPLAVVHPLGAVLLRKNWDIAPLGSADSGAWRFTITFAPDGGGDDGGDEQLLNFEVASETEHITQSIATVSRHVPSGKTAADFKQAIGVEKDEAKGVDIVVPRLSFGWSVTKSKAVVTASYVRTLAALVGRVNSAPYLGFQTGELLFKGVSGSRSVGNKNWSLNFTFEASPNVTDLEIGPDIKVASKDGYDYLWTSYELGEDDDADVVIPKPRQVNIEQVYKRVDFGPLGLTANQ